MNRRRPYELNLLNDLHEIVPEFLYDTEIATSSTLRFFQQRLSHMYPEFHRQRGYYLREQADSRRTALRAANIRPSRMPNPVITPSASASLHRAVPITHTPTTFTPPTAFMPPTVPLQTAPVIQTWESLQNSSYENLIRSLLLSIVNDNNVPAASDEDDEVVTPPVTAQRQRPIRHILRTARGGINITIPGDLDGGWWDPVSVRPSATLYNRNTEVLDASGVSLETNCSICQSHVLEDLSGSAVGNTWRRIRQCGHMFHTSCIDRWFSQNIHCPLCRTDIRTLISSSTSVESAVSTGTLVLD
jgi:Ring finger domain